MRDPKRIDRIIELIRMLWKLAPDLRLGQMLCIFGEIENQDIFAIEDTEVESSLLSHLHLAILQEHNNIKGKEL